MPGWLPPRTHGACSLGLLKLGFSLRNSDSLLSSPPRSKIIPRSPSLSSSDPGSPEREQRWRHRAKRHRKEGGWRNPMTSPTSISIRPTPQPARNTGTFLSNPRWKQRGGFQRARPEPLSPLKLQVADRLVIELSSLFALKRTNTSFLKSHLRQGGSKITAPVVSKEKIRKERPEPEINVGNRS